MRFSIRFRASFQIALCTLALLTAGCTRPLGPGFDFARRQAEIHAPTGAPEQVHIRITDHLVGVGNTPIRSLDVRMPDKAGFGAQNLRVTVGGREALLEQSSSVDRRLMRIEFTPAWERLESREIVEEWDLTSEQTARGTIGFSPAGFYIADDTALPLWQPPGQVFSTGGPTPDHETLTVIAPSDFRVLAPGKQMKRRTAGNLATYRFQIHPDRDFIPYVVAGRYQEQAIRTPQGTVSFWTFQPLDAKVVQTAAVRLSSSMQALAAFFEPSNKSKTTVHVIEAPGEMHDEFGAGSDPGGTSFPEGVLLAPGAIAQGITDESVLQLAEYELARTWFGWRVRPLREAQIVMGRGIGLFGVVVAAEARGQDQRDPMIASLLERYDAAQQIAPDKRLIEPVTGYSHNERITTGYKAALFFAMLEDLCGRRNLSVAMQDIIAALGGEEAGYEDLRSAAESASGRDLSEIFRIWFNRTGIPEEFRARYGHASNQRARN